jgi:hypothetical protein
MLLKTTNTNKAKLKNTKKLKVVQKFVRINIDSKLDKILSEYMREYPLLSNSDIIKMLVSKGIRQKQKQTFKQILGNQIYLNQDNEENQFQWLIDNGLDRKSKNN